MNMDIPRTLKGPFGSYRNFLEMVALPNYVDYESAARKKASASRREELRLLFNAAVSLDCVLDYMFHDRRDPAFEAFLSDLKAQAPVLGELRDLSNALKHCLRGRGRPVFEASTTAKHAKDYVQGQVDIDIDVQTDIPRIDVAVSVKVVEEAPRVLAEAFRFWVAHLQSNESVGRPEP